MAVHNFLIEGVSGSGKSSVCIELQKRGLKAINGDDELAYNGNPETGIPTGIKTHQTWIWDVGKVKKLTSDVTHEFLFLCGGSRNFNQFIDVFERVFILNIDNEALENRLLTRPGDVWGKSENELKLILKLNKTKEDLPKDGIIIDASQPLDKVVDNIIQQSTARGDDNY
jgi:broad-specificity NMP kinase